MKAQDYLGMVGEQASEQLALVCDERSYTYAELFAAASALRAAADFSEPCIFIHSGSIVEQLLAFLAYSGTATRPVIATEASKAQDFAVEAVPESACMGVLTSGSTGRSKLLWRNFASWADFFPEQNSVFGIDKKTVIFCQGSLAFTGNLNIYLGVLAAGGTLVVTERFRPKHWLELMERHAVNAVYLIPSKLLLLPKFLHKENKKVRSIISGSQSMGRQEADKLLHCFPQAEITLYYGASELNYITYIKDAEMTEDSTLIGRPFKNVVISIRNEEIFIDTPYHVEGVQLPFSLKDRGSIDDAGCLHFLGRTNDVCNINGIKVSCNRIACALDQLPEISEAVVLGQHVDDADILVAFLAGEKEYSKQELVRLLKEDLEAHEIPKRFVFLRDLPHNESGKVDKIALKKLL